MAVDLRPYGVKGTCNVPDAANPDAANLPEADQREEMGIVIVGHVDHGKSTVIGRLLADTGSLPEGRLERLREMCRRRGQPFEYAYLLDALRDEQAQGITIDAARCFFRSARRHYIIIDAPGHVEFLKNMVTGAARAEAALLVIDATEGIRENSRRHAVLLSLLGIAQVAVLINKMDLVEYDPRVYRRLVEEYSAFLSGLGMQAATFVPVSGKEGDNIVFPSQRMPWYEGEPVLAVLDGFQSRPRPLDKPLRMPVQAVYRFTGGGDRRRIVAGTIESGRLRVGDAIVFYPSGKTSRVRSIEAFPPQELQEVEAGRATGFTLEEQVYVRRGEVVARVGEPAPVVTQSLRADLFWLGKRPMVYGRMYQLKVGTARVEAYLEKILKVINASDLKVKEGQQVIQRHDVAQCLLRLSKPVAVDRVEEIPSLGRFVIVDQYEISGGGIVREAHPAASGQDPEGTQLRNGYGEQSGADDGRREPGWAGPAPGQNCMGVTPGQRVDRYRQQPTLLLLAGGEADPLRQVATALERRLFDQGYLVSLVSGARPGVNGQRRGALEAGGSPPAADLVWLEEAAPVLLDAGLIVVAAALSPSARQLASLRAACGPRRTRIVWLGEPPEALAAQTSYAASLEDLKDTVLQLEAWLRAEGRILARRESRQGSGVGRGPA